MAVIIIEYFCYVILCKYYKINVFVYDNWVNMDRDLNLDQSSEIQDILFSDDNSLGPTSDCDEQSNNLNVPNSIQNCIGNDVFVLKDASDDELLPDFSSWSDALYKHNPNDLDTAKYEEFVSHIFSTSEAQLQQKIPSKSEPEVQQQV